MEEPRTRGTSFWLDGLRALPGGVPETNPDDRTFRHMVYGVGLHDCSRNRARNWVHSRIWPSRDYSLSTPSTRKTAKVPLLSLVCGSCGSPRASIQRGI